MAADIVQQVGYKARTVREQVRWMVDWLQCYIYRTVFTIHATNVFRLSMGT